MTATLDAALSPIPSGLRQPLISQFEELLSDYRAGRWEAVGLKAGKICEIVYTILAGHVAGRYPASPSKPPNMVKACQDLENAPAANFSRSTRIQIPRLLIAIYELRNNRAIGHVGGEVDPNHMDAELFLRGSKWLVSELVRTFGALSEDAARDLIESVTERTIPVVWEGDGVKRVLNPSLSTRNKVLVLAYATPSGATARQLAAWSGYSNLSRLRSTVIAELDKEALVHFDETTDTVRILPTGVRHVEGKGLLVLK